MDDSNSNNGKPNAPRTGRGILAGQVERLGPAFRQRLARDREQLESLLAVAATQGEAAAKALRDLEIAAHKLHGTAAMFGYETLGAAAGDLEAAAHDAIVTPGAPADLDAQLGPRLAALTREIDAALAGGNPT